MRCHHRSIRSGTPRARWGSMSIARSSEPFSEADRDVFKYLVSQASSSVENVALHEMVSEQAVTDELTGLANNRAFRDVMDKEAARARRFSHPLSLVMLDIDDFKKVNDTYGHPQGDEVLRRIGRILRGRVARDRCAGAIRGRGVRGRASGDRVRRRRRAGGAHPGSDRGRGGSVSKRRRGATDHRQPRRGDGSRLRRRREGAHRRHRCGALRGQARGQESGRAGSGGRLTLERGLAVRALGRITRCPVVSLQAGSERWASSTTQSGSTSI